MALNEDQQTEAVFKSMRGEVDPVSGNEVPPGSLPEEVRDDVPAMLSEGEYVVPADVLRFYGVKFFEDLRAEAKMGLAEMESNGRIGGEPVMEDDELPFSDEELMVEDIPDDAVEMNRGVVVGFAPGGLNIPGYIKQPDLSFMGGTYDTGTSTGGVEYRTYVNDAGMTITIPFFNGEPMGMIPPGYKPGDATTPSEEDGTGGVTERGEIDRGGEGRSINGEQGRDTTKDAEAVSSTESPDGKTTRDAVEDAVAKGLVGLVGGVPASLADKATGGKLSSTVRDVVDNVFDAVIGQDDEGGPVTGKGGILGTGYTGLKDMVDGGGPGKSGDGKGLGDTVANALGFDDFADMFDGGGKGASAKDKDNDNDNGTSGSASGNSGGGANAANDGLGNR